MKHFIRILFTALFAVILSNSIYAQMIKSGNLINLLKEQDDGSSFFDNSDLNYKAGYLNESEELYGNSSIYQNIRFGKQFTDMFRLDIYSLIEYSKREQVGVPDRERWYDNASLVAKFDFDEKYRVEAFGSASISDTTFTSYGGRYRTRLEFGEFSFVNLIEGGYNYFYYWNQVGQDYLSESLDLFYSSLNLSLSYFYANVRENYIEGYDLKGRNPNTMFNAGLSYDVMNSPKINVGMYYQYRDYEHYSPLYFSPQDRNMSGFGAYFFDTYGKFYTYAGGAVKQDNRATFIWSFDAETGYENNGFSVSAGFGRYFDPYYRNTNLFLNIVKNF